MFSANLDKLANSFCVYLDSFISKVFELIIFDFQPIGSLFTPRVVNIFIGCFWVNRNEEVFEVIEVVGGSDLVENVNFGEVICSAILYGHHQAFDWIIDVDEGPSLFPSAIESYWVSAGNLRAEAVEDSPEITVNIDPIY